jgi:hypothetical protein
LFDIAELKTFRAPDRRVEMAAEQVVPTQNGQWEVIGRPGLPWSLGRLRLESNPDLAPVKARGSGSDAGVYFNLARTSPHVQAALRDFIASLTASPWRIEKPSLKPWHAGDPAAEAALTRQWRLAQYMWSEWTELGHHRDLFRWMADMLTYAYVCGFYLGEHNAVPETLDLGEGSREYLVFGLPELRAPWSISEWYLVDELPVGCKQRTSYSRDSPLPGGAPPTSDSFHVLPWWKLHHWTLTDSGPSDLEGTSALRPAYVSLKAIQIISQIQGLCVERDGLGTWVAEAVDPNFPPDEAEAERLEQHFETAKAEHLPWVRSERYRIRIESPNDSVPDYTAIRGIYERDLMLSLDQAHKMIGLHQHGSFAARESASADARDSYDLPASRLGKSIESLFRTALEANFPEDFERGYKFVPDAKWAQVETRSNIQYAQWLQLLTASGHIAPGPEIENVLRKAGDLPPRGGEVS